MVLIRAGGDGVPEFGRVTIVGLGLIGGSLGMALIHGGVAAEVVGFARGAQTRSLAVELEAVHRATASLGEAVAGAELVVLAVPVGAMPALAAAMKGDLSPGAIVTDVGSTKETVVHSLENCLAPEAAYVGGHPMSGSERSGVRAADPYLFENAAYVLTPTDKTPPEAVERVQALARGVGALPLVLDPAVHDYLVAAVSHLPHLVAVTLTQTLARIAVDTPEALLLTAGGFRDTTRVAGGDADLWRDIFLANREKLLQVLQAFRGRLDRLEQEIRAADAAGLGQTLEEARAWRAKIPARAKGLLPGIYELVVTVPDRPGVIARLGSILADRGINIIDIEILRVREGEGGSIRLGLQSLEAAEAAYASLRANNIRVQWR